MKSAFKERQLSDYSAMSQRPKRNASTKGLGCSNGLHWMEEKQLKKALYASLNETKKARLLDENTSEDSREQTPKISTNAVVAKKANRHRCQKDKGACPAQICTRLQPKQPYANSGQASAPVPGFKGDSGPAFNVAALQAATKDRRLPYIPLPQGHSCPAPRAGFYERRSVSWLVFVLGSE